MPQLIKLNKYHHRSKIAAFDYDHTLVKPKGQRKFPKDVDDWEWLRDNVPAIVKGWYAKGYAIVIVTNQSKEWKTDQIKTAIQSLDIPVLICIAKDKEEYKPNPLLWEAIVGAKKINKPASFFVGDALGRKADWSNTDALFAEELGVRAISPETMFPFPERPVVDIAASSSSREKVQELVLMIGYPGSGKSSVAKKLASKGGHVLLDSDVLKTKAKILRELKLNIALEKSVILDATNPTREGRAQYLAIAHDANIKARCIWVSTTMEEAMARNAQRETDKVVPPITYYVYRKKFEEPKEEEGCTVVRI